MKKIFITIFCLASIGGFSQKTTDQINEKVTQYLTLSEQMKLRGDIKEATRYLNEAATLCWEEKNYSDAIQYYNRSIALNRTIQNESGVAKIESNLGMIYSDMQQYDKALSHFQSALQFRENSEDKKELITTKINVAVVLNNLARYNDAASQIEGALLLATEQSDAVQMKSCYGMLAETYEKAGNQDRTMYYFNLYRTFHEMIQRDRVKVAHKETEQAQLAALKSDLEKREKEIELLTRTQQLKSTENELREVNKEAQALIDNNTKQELALSLLKRQLELDTLEVEGATARKTRLLLIVSLIILGVAFTATLILLRIKLYRQKNESALLVKELEEKIFLLETKIKKIA